MYTTPVFKRALSIGVFAVLAVVALFGWARKTTPQVTPDAADVTSRAASVSPAPSNPALLGDPEPVSRDLPPLSASAAVVTPPPGAPIVRTARRVRTRRVVVRRAYYRHHRRRRGRSLDRSALIVGGSAVGGAVIGGLAGGGKGAGIGAIAGGAAGLVYDHATHKK